jgi:phosphoglycerate dehydrogenase-like enzyme
MSILPETPSDGSATLSPLNIVVALSARERVLFFGNSPRALPSSWHSLSDDDLAGNWTECLERLQPNVLITGWITPPLPESWVTRPDCPLKYVCHVTGSVRRLVPRSFLEHGGVVTNWGESVSPQVAEHGLLLALGALRNAAHWRSFINRPVEQRRIEDLVTRTLFSRRIGFHGFGSVVRALIPLLSPFGLTLEAFSAGVPPEMMKAAGVSPVASLQELFSRSEVLFECEALTPATEKSVSAEILAALPDDAVFVNIGRGGLVDDAALQREVASGRLRVALDVALVEPLTPDSPYVRGGKVFISPHIGGPTLDRYAHCGSFALANLQAFLNGEVPPAAISLAAYDRAT